MFKQVLKTHTCAYCVKTFYQPYRGRTARFCSNACRQAYYRWAKNDFTRQRRSSMSMNIDEKHRHNRYEIIAAATYQQTDWIDL